MALDLYNLEKKIWYKRSNNFNWLELAKNVDLANLKLDVDKFEINKLKTVLTNLYNLKFEEDKLDADKEETEWFK